MLLSRATTQKLTACLALLAVLLLFVAPVVSNSRHSATSYETSNTHAHEHLVISNNPAVDHQSVQHHQAMSASHDHAAMQSEGFACGYCELLIHVPLIVWVFIPLLWLALLQARMPPPLHLALPFPPQRYEIHRPRAPPSLCL